jgi:Ca2+-binding EF-hand superfamily protein
MRLAQSLFFLVAAALAVAVGTAKAEDKIGKDENDPGFKALDKNNDGYVSRAEALGNPNLSKNFKQADKNNDGKLSRSEYLTQVTKQDAKTAERKAENAVDKHKDKDKNRSAATGSSAATGDKIGKDKNDPGFNKLDKNNDGYLSRTEAAGNPALAKNFKQVDKNGDGKLSRSEYLTAMTKQDLSTAKKKVQNSVDHKDKDNKAASGSSSK